MLQAYTTAQAVTGTANVAFTKKVVQTSYACSLSTDGTTISLALPGIYRVDFNGTATPSGTAGGDVAFSLLANGNAVEYAAGNDTAPAGGEGNVTFSTFVKVMAADPMSIARLSVEYEGAEGTIDLANIMITRMR